MSSWECAEYGKLPMTVPIEDLMSTPCLRNGSGLSQALAIAKCPCEDLATASEASLV